MDRIRVLQQHLRSDAEASSSGVGWEACSSVRVLPRFDSHTMERFIDDLCDFKHSVYEEFREHPELLPPVIEGLTKGETPLPHKTMLRCLEELLSTPGIPRPCGNGVGCVCRGAQGPSAQVLVEDSGSRPQPFTILPT